MSSTARPKLNFWVNAAAAVESASETADGINNAIVARKSKAKKGKKDLSDAVVPGSSNIPEGEDRAAGKMKTKDYSKSPHFRDPPPPPDAPKAESRWVNPATYYEELPVVMKEVTPLPTASMIPRNELSPTCIATVSPRCWSSRVMSRRSRCRAH